MLLKEMLKQRPVYQLYQLAYRKEICPDTLSKKDGTLLYKACGYDEFRKELAISAAKGKNDFYELDEEQKNDIKLKQAVEKAYEKDKHTGELLLNLQKQQDRYIEALSDFLKDVERARNVLVELSEDGGNTISSILDGTIRMDEEGYCPLDIKPDENYMFDRLESDGYCTLRRTPWYKNEDEREHLTGILIPEEILEVFRKADSKDVRDKRILRIGLDQCAVLLQAYYELGSLSLVKKIYDLLREAFPNKYPQLEEHKFQTYLDQFCKETRMLERICYKNEVYYATFFESDDINDSTEPDDSITVDMILTQKNCSYDFYIPSAEEVKGYIEQGTYITNPCFVRLREFIKLSCLDEKTLNEITNGMFVTALSLDKDYGKQEGYSMDDVENDTAETFSEIMMDIRGNNSFKDIYDSHSDVTAGFTDEAKDEFKELLKACCAECPISWYLGHSKKEVREKNLEPLGNED